MEMIACAQCGKKNQPDNNNCSACGAALIPRSFWDINGDDRVDFKDVKAVVKNLVDVVSDTFSGVKSVFRTQAEKDLASVEDLTDSFKDFPPDNMSESQRKLEQFASALRSTIELKIAERIEGKPKGECYLGYADAQILTASVHNIFMNALSFTPRQVSAACAMSKAILAPTKQEKRNLIKAAIGFSGGTAGIGMVISSVGVALGWGASAIASITAVFVGSSITGPIMWGVGGLSLLAIAGYFARTSNKEVDSERFTKVLKMSTQKAVEAIWGEYGEKLSESVN
ncbi:hypothetical protein [Desulfocastanea catecholica]